MPERGVVSLGLAVGDVPGRRRLVEAPAAEVALNVVLVGRRGGRRGQGSPPGDGELGGAGVGQGLHEFLVGLAPVVLGRGAGGGLRSATRAAAERLEVRACMMKQRGVIEIIF